MEFDALMIVVIINMNDGFETCNGTIQCPFSVPKGWWFYSKVGMKVLLTYCI